MQAVYAGIAKHQVILLTGDTNIRDVLTEYIYPKYTYIAFSAINMDLGVLSASLRSRRWDGSRPVIILIRCEQWMKEISVLLRDRQPKQSVIMVTDGEYTPSTPIMKSLAQTAVKVGKVPTSIFSLLRKGPTATAEKRYESAIESTDIRTIIDQIHYTNEDLDVSCALSDVDIMTHHVPETILVNCLPIRSSIVHTLNTKIEKKTASNLQFAATMQPIVALETHSMMSMHETLEYARYAHQIKVSPGIAKYPRDDRDPMLVQNVNDKLRVLVTICDTIKRASVVTDHPSKRKRQK